VDAPAAAYSDDEGVRLRCALEQGSPRRDDAPPLHHAEEARRLSGV